MKTHVIKDDGTVTVIEGKIKDLSAMQGLVKGPIEIVNAAMPAASPELPGSEALKEMVVNEEGLFNNSFKTNEKARKIIAQGLRVPLDNIQDIRGDVFVTEGWRSQSISGSLGKPWRWDALGSLGCHEKGSRIFA